MTIEIFASGKIDFTINEEKQFERIKKEMIEKFSKDDSRYCLIVDYVIGNKQYDIIVIKKDAIISIDLKGYKGKIIGSENGPWYVESEDNQKKEIAQKKNPFMQVRAQRYELLDFLNKILPTISERFKDNKIYNLTSILCFEKGSYFDIEQIDHKKYIWFNVSDELCLFDLIEKTTSNEFFLKDVEIDAILKEMNLNKLDIIKHKEKLGISGKSLLSSEDIQVITNRVVEDFGTNDFDLSDLLEIVDPEIAARYIKEAIDKKILKKAVETNKFCLEDKWSDNLPVINDDEDISGERDINKYSQKDFWLRPETHDEGTEYGGVYRGTIFHVDYKKNVWWRVGKKYLKINAQFSNEDLIDKILAIKPQGGSFRITEANEILTKVFSEGRGYISMYVGKFDGEIKLENLQWNPADIKKGDLWPSIYDGATFSVNGNKELLMHIGDKKIYAKEGHEDLVKKVLELKGKNGGGRFNINENGCILTLMYHAPYPEKIRKQIELLTPAEKNLIDIRTKTDRDGMIPIYIGKFKGNIKFQKMFDINKEWTKEEDEEFLKRIGC